MKIWIRYKYVGGSTPFVATARVWEKATEVSALSSVDYADARRAVIELAKAIPYPETVKISA